MKLVDKNGRQNMPYNIECKKTNQTSFSEKIFEYRKRRRERRKEIIKRVRDEGLRLTTTIGLLTIMSLICVPLAFRTRGYMAFGGEWLAMIFLSFIFWSWLGRNNVDG